MSKGHHSSSEQFDELYLQALKVQMPARRHCLPQAVHFKKCLHKILQTGPVTRGFFLQRIKCENETLQYQQCMKKIHQKQTANHLIAAYAQNPSYFNKEEIAPDLDKVVSMVLPLTAKVTGPTSYKLG